MAKEIVRTNGIYCAILLSTEPPKYGDQSVKTAFNINCVSAKKNPFHVR